MMWDILCQGMDAIYGTQASAICNILNIIYKQPVFWYVLIAFIKNLTISECWKFNPDQIILRLTPR